MFLFYQYFFLFYTVIQKETVWMPVQFLTVFCNVLKNMKRSVQDDTEIYKMAGSSTDFLSGKGLEAISLSQSQIPSMIHLKVHQWLQKHVGKCKLKNLILTLARNALKHSKLPEGCIFHQKTSEKIFTLLIMKLYYPIERSY